MAAKQKKTLEQMIRGGFSADEIIENYPMKLPTLQRKVGLLQAEDKEYYDIKGLYEKPGNIKFTGMGVIVHRTRLISSIFKKDDEFELSYDGDGIHLNLIK